LRFAVNLNIHNAAENFVYLQLLRARVARWHISKPKIPIWVNFGGYSNRRCWYSISPFGLFYGYLVYFVAIRYIFIVIWYIFSCFGMLYRVKSGNPAACDKTLREPILGRKKDKLKVSDRLEPT
jgi:hypothetical protein